MELTPGADRALKDLSREPEVDPNLSPEDCLKRAHLAHQQGQFEEAAGSVEKAVRLDPENPAYWNHRGRSLYALGNFEQGLKCYDQALDKDSRFAFARFNNALAEQKLGRKIEAARSFQQFLAIAPPHFATQIQNARERLAELRTA